MKKVLLLWWKGSEEQGIIRVYPADQRERAVEDCDLLIKTTRESREFYVDEIDFHEGS